MFDFNIFFLNVYIKDINIQNIYLFIYKSWRCNEIVYDTFSNEITFIMIIICRKKDNINENYNYKYILSLNKYFE